MCYSQGHIPRLVSGVETARRLPDDDTHQTCRRASADRSRSGTRTECFLVRDAVPEADAVERAHRREGQWLVERPELAPGLVRSRRAEDAVDRAPSCLVRALHAGEVRVRAHIV